ncbi:MAG: hypothetical protein MUP98_01615 [Candidatus Aminicenantes bacterium]|nr:hypothetical protein [Candidatus Aminicenantes bacterium]
MKKTTWAIIGLSICVVVLSTALGIVLLQQKTDTIIVRGPDLLTSSKIFKVPWQETFSLAHRPLKEIYNNGPYIFYYDVGPNTTVYHTGKAYGVSIGIKKNEIKKNEIKNFKLK